LYQPVVSSADAMCATAELSKLSGNLQGVDNSIAESHVVDAMCVSESSKLSGNIQIALLNRMLLMPCVLLSQVNCLGIYKLYC